MYDRLGLKSVFPSGPLTSCAKTKPIHKLAFRHLIYNTVPTEVMFVSCLRMFLFALTL